MKHKLSIDLEPTQEKLFYVQDRDASTNELIKDKFISQQELKTLMSSLLDPNELSKTREVSKLFKAKQIHIIQKD